MATRGFFTILNNEKNIERPYIGFGDVFVESFHDGYVDTMLDDILNIPKKMVKVCLLYRDDLWVFKDLNSLVNEQQRDSFDRFVGTIGIYDLTWDSLLHLLQLTNFNQYHRVEEGVIRYGNPITSLDSDFTVLCDFGRLSSKVIIKLSEDNKKRYLDEGEDFYNRVKFDDNGVFEFDLIKEFNDLLFEEIKKEE